MRPVTVRTASVPKPVDDLLTVPGSQAVLSIEIQTLLVTINHNVATGAMIEEGL